MKKLLAILLAMSLMFSLAACGNAAVTSSDSDATEIVDTEVDASTDASTTDESTAASTTASTAASTASKTSSSKIDLEKLKGTTVKLLMWRSLTDQEEKTIAAFEKEYSIKVKVSEATLASYVTKLASLVATGDSPDIGVIPTNQSSQGCFPIGAATIFQPASVTKQDFTDGFWNTEAMEAFSIKGQYFPLIASNNWYENNATLFYNADMFAEDKIEDPYTLWKAGNWNWDTFKSTAKALKAKGHKYGYVVNQQDNLMLSTGSDFVEYKNGQFTTTVTSQNVIKAWTFNAEMVSEGLQPVYGTDSNAFINGDAGMIGAHTWWMRKGEAISNCKFEVMAVPFPSPKGQTLTVSSISNKFAIPKGAKNPVAAGVFLRYFLDSANNGKFSDISYNAKMEEVFNYLCSDKVKKAYPYSIGVIGYTNLSGLKSMYTSLHSSTPSQITTVLQKNKQLVDSLVTSVNSKIK